MDNEWRVEPRNMLVGTGMGVTPERIQDIEAQRAQSAKIRAPKPERAFKEVLAATIEKINKQAEAVEDELPKKPSAGLGLLSAYQKDILGIEDESLEKDSKVLIKG